MSSAVLPDSSYQKDRIVTYTRNINLFFFGVVFIVLTIMAFVMAIGITDRASENLARLYAIEAVGKFELEINQELIPVQKVSVQKTIIDWFSDENNPGKKEAAYRDMIELAYTLQNGELYFVIHNSLNEYSLNKDSSLDKFIPFNTINQQFTYDSWYFNCIYSDHDFTLNIDVDKATNTRRLRINHKVMQNAEILGVFSSWIPYFEMTKNLFAHYNNHNVKGFIIDNNGMIQMGSNGEKEEDELHILSVSDNPGFNYEMAAYLKNIDDHFDATAQTEVIKLTNGPYNNASIAPVIGTDWSVVTFYNNESLFSLKNLLPLLIVMLSAFLIYTLISNIFMHRLILLPLKQLAESLTVLKLNANEVAGMDRNDEIGKLAQTIQKMWNHLSVDNAKLLRAAREQERLIRIDQLTNIPNRRSFDERLPLEWGRAIRTKTPISLLILDLDHFKDYNDTYGHIQGDRALQLVSKIFMQELKRPGDLAARWGGEEFVVLLANTDSKGATDVAERIRQNVEKTNIMLIDGMTSKITISVGINTTIPMLNDALEDFIRSADMALYRAKREGRNRVCQAGIS